MLLLSSGADERGMIDRAASFDIRFRRILLQKSAIGWRAAGPLYLKAPRCDPLD
jgi:hypothetical protein